MLNPFPDRIVILLGWDDDNDDVDFEEVYSTSLLSSLFYFVIGIVIV